MLSAGLAGQQRRWRGVMDARWTMAHAAGIGRARPEHLDTTRPHGVVAHPLFTVAPEWALLTGEGSSFDFGVDPDEAGRGVHAAHQVLLHRPVVAGTEVELVAVLSGLERSAAGTRMTIDFAAATPQGAALWDTRMTSVHLGVDLDGPDCPPARFAWPAGREPATIPPADHKPTVVERAIGPGDAHVYSECARIWNPIHTDPAVARAVGLPGTILHGTATLAHGVSAVMDVHGALTADVAAMHGRFRATVALPDTLTVDVGRARALGGARSAVEFTIANGAGDPAVSAGQVVLRSR